MAKQVPKWIRESLAELIGTYLLILIGDASCASSKLNKSSKMGFDLFAVAFAWGIAVMIGITISLPISGAHLNPAVTLGLAVAKKFPFNNVPHYIISQYLGGFLAALTVYINFREGIYDFGDGKLIAHPINKSEIEIATGTIFATFPAPWMDELSSFIEEVIATYVLLFAILGITSNLLEMPKYLYPFFIGMIICGLVLAFGLQTGATLNPARDFSPRLVLLIFGFKNSFSPNSYLYWIVTGILAPHIGAILATLTYDQLIIPDREIRKKRKSKRKSERKFSRKSIISDSNQSLTGSKTNLTKNSIEKINNNKLMDQTSNETVPSVSKQNLN